MARLWQRLGPLSRANRSPIRRSRSFHTEMGRLEDRALLSSVSGSPGVITYLQGSTQQIYSFVNASNGHLEVNYWNGSAWQWADQGTPAGTTLTGNPGVVAYQQGGTERIYAFDRGANGHLYVNYWNGSAWNWADQGTPA